MPPFYVRDSKEYIKRRQPEQSLLFQIIMKAILILRMSFLLAMAVVFVGNNCFASDIKVYTSTAPLNDEQVLSGLLLQDNTSNIELTQLPGLSICVRFNFKRLLDSKSVLYRIESGELEQQSWKFANFVIGYSASSIGFGKDHIGSVPSWIITEKDNHDDFSLWSPNKWHHVCMSYERFDSYISVVMVRMRVVF